MVAIKNIDIKNADQSLDLEFDVTIPGRYSFTLNNTIKCELTGVDFGIASEECAVIEKIKRHSYMNSDGFWVDYKAHIPFGSEPHISRKLESVNNYCKISTAVSINTGFPFSELNIDKLTLEADWDEIGVVTIDKDFKILTTWHKIDNDIELNIYSDSTTFLACILKTQDGKCLEIGQGDDLWRWNVAMQLGMDSKFTITSKNDKVIIDRKVGLWNEEFEIKRDWRFKWYFAWSNNSDSTPTKTDKITTLPADLKKFTYNGETAFKLPSEWAKNTQVVINGETSSNPCYHAPAFERYFKAFIRNIKNKVENQTIYLYDIEPHICTNASHVERPKKKNLLHWDIINILEFQFWANRQLNESNSRVVLVPADESTLAMLPSLNYS